MARDPYRRIHRKRDESVFRGDTADSGAESISNECKPAARFSVCESGQPFGARQPDHGARLCRAAGAGGGRASILFNDNHCEAEPAANTGINFAIVALQGGAVIASQNRVRWSNNDFDAMNISGTKAFTVLGNITMGNIRIDGGVLPAPWDALNILAS